VLLSLGFPWEFSLVAPAGLTGLYLAFSFSGYYIALTASEMFAVRGTIPPFLAGWHRMSSSELGIYLLVKAANDSPFGPSLWLSQLLDFIQEKWRQLFENVNRSRILQRYVLVDFLRLFLLSLSSLIFIYLVVLFFQKMNIFIKHQARFTLSSNIWRLRSLCHFPVDDALCYLAGHLLTLGNLSRHSELTAMKAGSQSYRITFPLLIVALILSFVSFLGNEYSFLTAMCRPSIYLT